MPEQTMKGAEEAACAIWEAESIRATGRSRSIAWAEVLDEHKDRYRVLASAALLAARQAKGEDRDTTIRTICEAYQPRVVGDPCVWPNCACKGPAQAADALSPPAASGWRGMESASRGIYIASKTKHAGRWRFLRDKVGEPITSTWIDEAGEGESADLNDLWVRCIREASTCALLILYREKDDVLKGGWIELGAALAAGVPVYAVGIEEFTVAKYHGIQHFPSMKAAIAASRALLRQPLPSPPTGDGTP